MKMAVTNMLDTNESEARPPTPHSIAERASFVLVLVVWLGALVATHVYIATYAARTAFADDISVFDVSAGRIQFWPWLWSLHNEHRLPIPKAFQLALYHLTGDIRSGMYVQAEIYAATALACILIARKLRGGSRPWDAFFPLMWLQLGNTENLLMGFQVCIAIPTACVCTVLFTSVFSPMRLLPSRALATGMALLALPMCGGAGMLHAPALCAWTAWLGWKHRGSGDARERVGARLYLAFAAATVAVSGLYMIGFRSPSAAKYVLDVWTVLRMTLGTLSMAFGPSYDRWWPASGWIIALVAGAAAFAIGRRAVRSGTKDVVAMGTLAVLAACACLAAGIAFGRPAPAGVMLIANRYIPLPAPFFVTLTLGTLAVLGPKTRELLLAACFVAMAAATPSSIDYGRLAGQNHRESEAKLDELVRSGASANAIRAHYDAEFFSMARHGWWPLDYFAKHRLPPFDRARDGGPSPFDPGDFAATPFEVEPATPPMQRMLDGEMVYCLSAGTTLRFACHAKSRALGGWMGAPKLLVELGKYPGLQVRAVLRDDGGHERELGEIAFDPVHNLTDRGMRQFDFRWEPGPTGELLLQFEAVDRSEEGLARSSIKLRDLYVE